MEQFTKGLRGAAGALGSAVGSRWGIFGILQHPQDEDEDDQRPGWKGRPPANIEYVDEVNDDHRVPSKYYPDLCEMEDDHTYIDPDDFLVIENSKISPSCSWYYLPFSQTEELCNRRIYNWLQQTWFLPSDWKKSLHIQPPKPQYVPFFVFDVTTTTKYHASVLLETKSINNLPVKQWGPADGTLSSVYNEIIACGSCSVNTKLIQSLLNQSGFSHHSTRKFPTDPRTYKQSMVFTEEILPLEITKDEAWKMGGQQKVEEWEEQKAREVLKADFELSSQEKIRDLRTSTTINIQAFVMLLPIYFSGFEYASHLYEVLVSGNLGVVVGNRPVGTGVGGKFLIDKIKSVSTLVSDTVPLM